jgi:hypothetical protein
MTPVSAIVAILAVAAQSPAVPEKPRVLVLEPTGEAVEAGVRETVASLVSIELSKQRGIDVIASSDVKKMAALEAEKQTIGCDDAGACLAELAGAMGARFVVFGDTAKLGTLTVVNLSLFDSQQARAVGRVSIQVKGLEELPERIAPAVRELIAGAPDLAAASSSSSGLPQSAVVEQKGGAPLWATIGMWSLVGVGAIVGAGGLAFDLTSATSGNGAPDVYDAVGPVAYGVAALAIGGGVALGVLAPAEGP